ncbi:MAG: hypothetical protein IPG55_12445 [Saprospiraceae bacterium]|nr:hypothetical protein [Candidatus Defluviibacterium haderslevense]MBK7244369.1 hypothetical protein [Candidatus Defluviibacterium haderslevense]
MALPFTKTKNLEMKDNNIYKFKNESYYYSQKVMARETPFEQLVYMFLRGAGGVGGQAAIESTLASLDALD